MTVTGATAVVTYTLSGALSKLGSATQAFVYSGGGQWWLAYSDLLIYQHGSVKGDIAAAKAAGYWSSTNGCAWPCWQLGDLVEQDDSRRSRTGAASHAAT